MGTTLWMNKKGYIENSPVLYAEKVSTPVLIIANKMDGNVLFSQGLEWYLALRRLKKKAWLLQYDGQRHGMEDIDSYKDYVFRMLQFFNYFLKGDRAPLWLSKGIPAKLKGKESGFKLDAPNSNF
jgi:dipeptidyl aminopeptidase/acylaminoacyl peptidase